MFGEQLLEFARVDVAFASPGENRLQIVASSAPRPVVCTGSGALLVPNTGRSRSIAVASSRENSGLR
jgi:hypothetical protein